MSVAGRRSEEVAAILDQPLQEERIAARVVPSEAIATKNPGRIDVKMWRWSAFLIWSQAASRTPAMPDAQTLS
jgi:hypothetical protein